MKKYWKPLVEGDCVDIVAPGWATEPEIPRLAQAALAHWGLKARVPKNFLKPDFLGSHHRDTRASHLEKALMAPDSKVIWALRGGYGSLHVLERLNRLPQPKTPKLLIGISDLTSLHSFLAARWGWPSLHGPLLDLLALGRIKEPFLQELKDILFGNESEITFKRLKPLNNWAKEVRTLKAPIVGGNLMVFQSLIGTPYQVSLKGKILFIEDIGERAYRVDRALEHLWQAGPLKGVSALIFGDFIGGLEKDGTDMTPSLMKIWAQRLQVPVLRGLEAGHGDLQRPVPFLTPASLTLGVRPRLVIETGARTEKKGAKL